MILDADRPKPGTAKVPDDSAGNDAAKVCVVVPVRNRPDLLRACLRSLVDQQMPTISYEIIVCDDGSTVDLFPVIEEFQPGPPRVSIVNQKPKGPAAARNMGFRSRDAEIFVCVDSDVVCEPMFLSSLISALRQHEDWVAAEATVLPVGETGPVFDAPVNHGGTYGTGASAYRATSLIAVGGLDEAFPFPACEDAELAARLLRLGPYGYVPDAVVYHPTRRVTWLMQWRSRKYWRFVMILAKRYGFLAFPGRPAGPLPRFRVALAAVLTLPGGRFLNACKHFRAAPPEAIAACYYALFDVVCGICALPAILFGPVPPRKNYLE
jgi:GT2 family glycosyltransferase